MNTEKEQTLIPFVLRAVYLRGGNQWMSDQFDPTIPAQQVFGEFKASGHEIKIQEFVDNLDETKTIKSCQFTANFDFRYLSQNIEEAAEESDAVAIATISARITVDYLLDTTKTLSQAELESWASSSALFHSWPYWREFCHSTLMRMNLPIAMMPIMELKQNAKNGDTATSTLAEQ